jgi:calcineurin-like phosphoesterase
VVIQVMARLFMPPLDDPFAVLQNALKAHRLGVNVDVVLVDIHGEATSEKMALAHTIDGRATLAVGSHTHIPTADAQIFPGGTAYQTDAGMCGDYDSVIGVIKQNSIDRFTKKQPTVRLEPALGEATLCGVFVESDDTTGLARHVAPLRLGGRLAPAWPLD